MTHTDLKPCPFCQKPLTVNSANDAVCQTSRCWMASRLIAIPLDVPDQVEAWNTRTPDTTPSTDLIARAEAWVMEDIADESEIGLLMEVSNGAAFVGRLITALRAAEAEIAELTAFRNSYKDTIRRLQDSVSAAEAREQKLREALEQIVRECDALNKGPVAVSIARRALGGSNEPE